LSALAVVAERNDLIGRLIGASPDSGCFEKKGVMHPNDNFGVVEVKLFVDGFWKTIIMDDFLPCLIDLQSAKDEFPVNLIHMPWQMTAAGPFTKSTTFFIKIDLAKTLRIVPTLTLPSSVVVLVLFIGMSRLPTSLIQRHGTINCGFHLSRKRTPKFMDLTVRSVEAR